MGTLHQLLAVKKDTAKRANEIAAETQKTLGSKHFFYGSLRSYIAFDAEDTARVPDEAEQMSYTVGEKLRWFAENFGRHMDVEFQIDSTNKNASASIEVDGFEALDVPATYLLDLITALEKVRKVYSTMPVLDPKYQWEEDPDTGEGVHKVTEPERSHRSKKVLQHQVLYDATDRHPAQVEKWTEDTQVGEYTKRIWSGAVTAAQKAAILGRIDKLITAVKRALSSANDEEQEGVKIADRLFAYIHGDLA